ncbi:MAG: hypothetical protein CYG59_24770 [Chloroflexi bacterium]|nr:MAG: hypothetical protein CYG59_24770 [Chloroflexota bacterium]
MCWPSSAAVNKRQGLANIAGPCQVHSRPPCLAGRDALSQEAPSAGQLEVLVVLPNPSGLNCTAHHLGCKLRCPAQVRLYQSVVTVL